MIAVAVVGLTLGLIEERRIRFESLATDHQSKTRRYVIACGRRWAMACFDLSGQPMTRREVEESDWHLALAQKYRGAAARPWLPVEPDPPEPE
jgi:hypothetical protein